MSLLGHLSLWLAFLVGLWGAITGFAGGVQRRPDLQLSARHATFALFGALIVAVVSLEVAIFRHDFSLEYVAAYTSRNLPTFYLWSEDCGSYMRPRDRKSTRLNSSHDQISYAVFC